MLPAIALGGPDDLLVVVEVVAELFAGIARASPARIDVDHAVDLVPALVVLEGLDGEQHRLIEIQRVSAAVP